MTYVVVTLPQLQKAVEVPVTETYDDEDGNKRERPKMKDAPAGEDGKVPQEEVEDKDGKKKMVNKKVQEVRVEKRDRALRYPWISCKAKPRTAEDDHFLLTVLILNFFLRNLSVFAFS